MMLLVTEMTCVTDSSLLVFVARSSVSQSDLSTAAVSSTMSQLTGADLVEPLNDVTTDIPERATSVTHHIDPSKHFTVDQERLDEGC